MRRAPAPAPPQQLSIVPRVLIRGLRPLLALRFRALRPRREVCSRPPAMRRHRHRRLAAHAFEAGQSVLVAAMRLSWRAACIAGAAALSPDYYARTIHDDSVSFVVYAADEVSSLFVELASVLPLAQMKAANCSDSTVEKGPATGSPSRGGPTTKQAAESKTLQSPAAGDTRNTKDRNAKLINKTPRPQSSTTAAPSSSSSSSTTGARCDRTYASRASL